MIFYYIDTIEQTVATEESQWTINEYGKREQWKLSYPEVQAKFFKKLSDVSADIGKNHYYMSIKLRDSNDGVLDEYTIGTRQEPEPKPEPEPEPEPNEEG